MYRSKSMREHNSIRSVRNRNALASLPAVVVEFRGTINRMLTVFTVFVVFSLAACGGGGHDSGDCRYNEAWLNGQCSLGFGPDPLPGGIWAGVDSDGGIVFALVTDTGRFHYLDESLNQGSGILVLNPLLSEIYGDFQLVPALGFTLPDGAASAECTMLGDLVQRQAITLTATCTTTAGLEEKVSAELDYDSLYDRDSSLAAMAGNYDDGTGTVLNINALGTMFEQSTASGCVLNGRVGIIDSAFNLYDVEFGYSSCNGDDVVLNGTNFVGMAVLDNSSAAEALIVVATGVVDGALVSVNLVEERL